MKVPSGSTCARSRRQASVLHERIDRGGRRLDGAEVAHHRDAERAGVEPAGVRPDDVAVDAAGATLVDRAEAVDERVVADVVPAVALDVVELDRAHDRRRLEPRVRVRPGGVMDVRHPERVRVARLALHDRLVRLPRRARDESRDAGRGDDAEGHLRDGAPDRQRAGPVTRPTRPHLDGDRPTHPDGCPDAPAATRATLGAAGSPARPRRASSTGSRTTSARSPPASGARPAPGRASGSRRAGTVSPAARRSSDRASPSGSSRTSSDARPADATPGTARASVTTRRRRRAICEATGWRTLPSAARSATLPLTKCERRQRGSGGALVQSKAS